MEKLNTTVENFLEQNPLGRICTIDEHGYPHCVRVDFVYHEQQIYVGASGPRKWITQLQKNPMVAFETDVYELLEGGHTDWRGLLIKGEAEVIEDEDQRRRAAELLQQRHPVAPFGPNPTVVRITFRYLYRWGPWDEP